MVFFKMKTGISSLRLSALSLALLSAFSAHAQSESSGTLKEVVVTANRFSEASDSLPYGVSVITAKEIASSGATSVSEAIMRLLGVPGRLDTSGGNNYGLDLRGFGSTADSNQVVIVDGRRMNEQDLSTTGLGTIPIETVQRIEVIRGNAAVVYGEGATGGAIIVTTKAGQGMERRNSASVSATTGSFGLKEYRTNATIASGGFSVDVAASDRTSSGHRDNFASTNNNLGATLQWTNDWLRMGAQSSRNMQSSGWPGSLTATKYNVDPGQAQTPKDNGQLKSETSGLFLEALVGNWQFGLDVGEKSKKTNSNYIASNYFTSTTVNANSANVRARNEFKNSIFANAFTIGTDLGEWKSVTDNSSKARSESNAVYLSDDITYLATGTRLSVGFRNENLKKSKDSATIKLDEAQTAWHVGLTQELGNGVQTYGRTGQSFRLANVDEINFITPGVTLKPQISKDLELGLRWKNTTGKIDLRWYRSDLTNEIGYDSTAPGPFGSGANVNFDPTQRQGIELEARQNLSTQTALRFNAATRQARFVAGQYEGKDIALVPSNTVALGIEWVPVDRHLLNIGVTWVASQKPDFANTCTMPAYTTVDARYSYATKEAEFSFGINNIGDSKYYTLAYGCTGGGQPTSIYPEAGRALAATVKLKF
jgi:iron complex outermembrane receptor protein